MTPLHFRSIFGISLFLLSIAGCDRSSSMPSSQATQAEQQELIEVLIEAEQDAQNAEAPEPKINLATPPGWSKGQPRPLPEADHGFTIAYEHESGLDLTFYQFTRGHISIPNDVGSTFVVEEMQKAKTGIEQAVKFGMWKAAKEKQNKTIFLGDSKQQALWSRYELTVDEMTLDSDIYVWAQSNTLFKIRCTSRGEDITTNQQAIQSLLTAFGSSSAANQ